MNAQSKVVGVSPDEDYPLANTEATRMLAEGLKLAEEEKGLSQRSIAKLLNYKSSVVLSHMALGRVPIPIDRCVEIARLLKLESGRFLKAVLQQRHPDIDFDRLLGKSTGGSTAKARTDSYVVDELQAIAGKSLDELPVEKVDVLREVVGDNNPSRRWLGFNELPTVEVIRQVHPRGLSPADRAKLREFLEGL
jgi:DNA-binding transcriptional regulator YdaS (Cro superfamily)